MRILRQSQRRQPRISLILLDWGVRESFHLLDYLQRQTVDRNSFEVILVEYYSGISKPLEPFAGQVDTWVLLEMPADCYYHKHLMYNTGIVLARGQIVMIADSDAMVRPSFLATVLAAFDRDPEIVYHLDQFRNLSREYYPFNYPSFEQVLGEGCVNHSDGKTTGIVDQLDPVHSRNYGACMCARRADLIAIGGADEDLSFLGHVCGPYDMTFRLMNFERRLRWETAEYLFHTWHPGSDGVDNYLGPHDGRNVSTTALGALTSGRVPPLVENRAIRHLRLGEPGDPLPFLIDPAYPEAFSRARLGGQSRTIAAGAPKPDPRPIFASYRGIDIYRSPEGFCALRPHLDPPDFRSDAWRTDERILRGGSFLEVARQIDRFDSHLLESLGSCDIYDVGPRFAVVPSPVTGRDFLVHSHRENPLISWADTLTEAHTIAARIEALRHLDRPAAEATRTSLIPTPGRGIEEIEQRLREVEASVRDISQSQTWRALTGAAGFLQAAVRTVRRKPKTP